MKLSGVFTPDIIDNSLKPKAPGLNPSGMTDNIFYLGLRKLDWEGKMQSDSMD